MVSPLTYRMLHDTICFIIVIINFTNGMVYNIIEIKNSKQICYSLNYEKYKSENTIKGELV